MTPTPPSNGSSQGAISPDGQHRVTRKRNRVPLSCAPCRGRKLKCNRSSPCDNCIKRGDTASCSYASTSNRRRHPSSGADIGSPDEMQTRIDRLENLVLSLMTNGAHAVGPDAARAVISRSRPSVGNSSEQTNDDDDRQNEESEVETVSKSIGVMKMHNDRQFYASEAHWWAILSDIAEVKRYFAEHTQQYEEQAKKVTEAKASQGSSAATSLLFKGTQKIDLEKILSNFPPRAVADALIQRYFQTENPAIRILHGPTFRHEYERHWQRPSETSIVWVGMCFAMMSMALNSYHRAGDEPEQYRGTSHSLSETYAEWTAQCLVAADFTQPVGFMVEALIFYALAEYSRRRDVETGLWMLQGMIVRLAMRMGMHRDSKPFPNMGAYLGEMRRRTWSVIRTMDILLSFQCGLPSMILSSDTDTALPTNIYDEEFYPEIQNLPPSRPSSENTPVSFMIAHTRITYVLGRIQEHAMALNSPSYEATMKLDAELREAYGQIPEHLRLQCRDGSSLDSGDLVMQRFTLDLTFHKSQCVLHRKFLARARKDSRYSYSHRACLESCLQMLEHQSILSREGQQGGRLRSVTWAIATSLTTHDFLLAAMVVCLDLYFTAQAEADGRTSGEMYQWAATRREEMFTAIERAVRIWETLKDQSMEAYKASSVLKVMLEKLKNHQILRQQLHQTFSFNAPEHNVAPDSKVAPEHSAAMTLGMMSTGMMPDAMGGMYDRTFGNGTGQTPRMSLTPQPNAGTPGVDGMGQGQQQQGSSLTPLGAGNNGGGGNTPFNILFGPGFGGFEGLDLPNTSLDWDGWDTYIHGPHRSDAFTSANMFDMQSFPDQFEPPGMPGANTGSTPGTGGMSQASTAQTPMTDGTDTATGLIGPAKYSGYGGPGAGSIFVGGDAPNLGGM